MGRLIGTYVYVALQSAGTARKVSIWLDTQILGVSV